MSESNAPRTLGREIPPGTPPAPPAIFNLSQLAALLAPLVSTEDPARRGAGMEALLTDTEREMLLNADVKRLPGYVRVGADPDRKVPGVRIQDGKPVRVEVPALALPAEQAERNRILSMEHLTALAMTGDAHGADWSDKADAVRYYASVYAALYSGAPNRKGGSPAARAGRNAIIAADGRIVPAFTSVLNPERAAMRGETLK